MYMETSEGDMRDRNMYIALVLSPASLTWYLLAPPTQYASWESRRPRHSGLILRPSSTPPPLHPV